MGIPLNHPIEGSVGWAGSVGANWTTLQNQYVANEKSDTTRVTVSSTTSETVLMANTTIPANALAPGVVMPIWASGFLTIPANAAPTITFRLRWGGLSGVLLATSTFTPATSTSAQTLDWLSDFRYFDVTAGASGTVDGEGWFMLGILLSTALAAGLSTIDTTTAKLLVWTAQTTVATVSISQDQMVTNLG